MNKKIFRCLPFSLALICFLSGCSIFGPGCYNDSIDSTKYSEIKSVPKIRFEVIKNKSSVFDEVVESYIIDNPGENINDPDTQFKILDYMYVNGVFKEAQDGYFLLDRDSYIVFAKYFDTSINVKDIIDINKFIDILNEKTKNYFKFNILGKEKEVFRKQGTDEAYKIIGTLTASIPFIKNISLPGFAAILEDKNNNSAIMIVLTDKAFNSKTQKEMEYMVKSLAFDYSSQGTGKGKLEFDKTTFSVMLDSRNILFDFLKSDKQPQLDVHENQTENSKYKFITYTEIEKGEIPYEVITLKTGEKHIEDGFVLSVMDNITLSSMVYLDEHETVDLKFIEDRVEKRAKSFISSLKASPNVYRNIEYNGVFITKNSAYAIITYDLRMGKDEYSCIEIYKEELTEYSEVISYNVSYKPLTPASNDSKIAYNELMTEFGLRK